jgi:Phosphoenolpyruvate carboxylase
LNSKEFWKKVPPSEPYRVILGDVRDKLYNTRERARHLLSQGHSDIPEDATFTNVEEVYLIHLKLHSRITVPVHPYNDT